MKSSARIPDSKFKNHLPAKPDPASVRMPRTAPAAQIRTAGSGPLNGPKTGPTIKPNLAATGNRQTSGSFTAQRKTATAIPRQPPVAPPAYRPQPIPRVLQAKMAATPKTSIAHRGVIQRHPMIISVEGRKSIGTDTNHFNSIEDVTQYLPQGASSSRVTSICIRKERNADHQYVIATTSCGINLKMHLGAVGAEIKCGREISPEFGLPRGDFRPQKSLTLGDAVGIFYQLAHRHAFESDSYNCSRFASDLASSMGEYIREENDDFDAFL
jgi:hypothetical protein